MKDKENMNHQIRLNEMRIKIIDELQNEGNLRQVSTGKPRSEINFEWKDFQEAWSKFPNEHKDFTWFDLVKMYNDFHGEMKEYYGDN